MSIYNGSFDKDTWFTVQQLANFTGDVMIQNGGYDYILVSYNASPDDREGFKLKAGEALRIKGQASINLMSPNFPGIVYIEEV